MTAPMSRGVCPPPPGAVRAGCVRVARHEGVYGVGVDKGLDKGFGRGAHLSGYLGYSMGSVCSLVFSTAKL